MIGNRRGPRRISLIVFFLTVALVGIAGLGRSPAPATADLPVTTCERLEANDPNACLALAQTVLTTAVTPKIDFNLSAPQGAVPGDTIDYIATLKNTGSSFALTGGFQVGNLSATDATVQSYYDYVEYLSPQSVTEPVHWVPLFGHARAKPEYTPRSTPPISSGLTVTSTHGPAVPGVTYPTSGDPILDTKLGPATAATWDYTARAELTAAQATELLQTISLTGVLIRHVVHYEVTGKRAGVTKVFDRTREFDFTAQLKRQSGELRDAQIKFTKPSGTVTTVDSMEEPGLARVRPGDTVEVNTSDPTSAIAPKGQSESDSAYLARLDAADGAELKATAELTAKSTGESVLGTPGQGTVQEPLKDIQRCTGFQVDSCGVVLSLDEDRTASDNATTARQLPVVALTKSGPPKAAAGTTVTYSLKLKNQGGATARTISLADQLDGHSSAAVVDGPKVVAAGRREYGHAHYDLPDTQATGSLSDTATVAWKDANQNAYGPISDDFTTNVISYPVSAPAASTTGATPMSEGTKFLYTGSGAIQSGVSQDTIAPQRAAVLRGFVSKRDGEPLSGVTVSVVDHPEFGTTQSRDDGAIYMAVNGGGTLRVRYEKDGYLPLERQVDTAWQDYSWLKDAAMIPLDTAVTDVTPGSTSLQVAQASSVTDDDGTRRSTVLFPAGTNATMKFSDGSTQSLSDMHVRATEYTVGETGPEAMPGELPPRSAYTYAADLTVDEALSADATQVDFSQSVPVYTDNFLGMSVGETVPAGYYDAKKGAWVAGDSGRVIKILSESTGVADLDIDGSGTAASSSALSSLGISNAERAKLADLYDPGKTLWRVPVQHFTPWDFNWGGLPGSAVGPDGEFDDALSDQDCPETGSKIECANQTLGEQLPVTGTEFDLHYQSERTPGRKAETTVDIPLTSSNPSEELKRVELEVTVAGRRFSRSFSAEADQKYTYTWDGKDVFGRPSLGSHPATIRVGYVYDATYAQTARFGLPPGNNQELDGNRTRREWTIWRTYRKNIGSSLDARTQGLGGWTLDVHHSYDPVAQTLYMGDGTRRSEQGLVPTIDTVAGNGTDPSGANVGDGGPATSASVGDTIRDLEVGPDGSLYIAAHTYNNNRIRRVAPDGTITTVAGKYDPTFYDPSSCSFGVCWSGDGGPATQALLGTPFGLAIGPDGSIYVAEYHADRIRRITPDGIIRTVPGTAGLGSPSDVEVAPDGTLYIQSDNTIRRLATDGTLTNLAGAPYGSSKMDIGPDGSLYVANGGIKRFMPDGTVKTLAGQGGYGSGGDGGPAIDAQFRWASDVAVQRDGSFYVADSSDQKVRRVDTNGIITTFAGTGTNPYSNFDGNGGPAKRTKISDPYSVAIAPDGSVYMPDSYNRRIRRVKVPLPLYSGNSFQVPSEDGTELYEFDANGRHLRTRNTLTNAIDYSFGYDNAGRLTSVTDGDNNVTQIERDGSGKPTAIVSSYGQRTSLTLDANGYLSSVSNPESETTQLSYSSDGLLQSLTDPKGGISEFTYDSLGRLTKDEDRADGFKSLSRTEIAGGHQVTTSTALDRSSVFKTERLAGGDLRRTFTDSSGNQSQARVNQDGTATTTASDGTTSSFTGAPDPRFGMAANLPKSESVATPAGRQLSIQQGRTVTLQSQDDPLSLQTQTSTLSLNGRNYNNIYNTSLKRYTTTSPANRTTIVNVDAQGRPLSQQISGLNTVSSTYDTHGRLSQQTQGTRAWGYTYNSAGYLASFTDPLSRTTGFVYDGAGRVTTETLPDSRQIAYGYDDNGNLSSVTPPSKPAHSFSHTALDLTDDYTPPDLGSGAQPTHYTYNDDGDLTRVTKPGNVQIDYGYDSGGRLDTITQPSGATHLTYSSQTGNLASATAPGNDQIAFAYDGSLPTRETFSGPVAGEVSRTYDDDLRVASSSVNSANTVNYTYDADGLLTGAGSLTLARSTQNGLLSSTSLSNATTALTYNSYGEPLTASASYNSSPIYSSTYTRDAGGRISQKTETTSQGTHSYAYTYDQAGRLTDVTKDSTSTVSYDYDSNGNRLSRTSGGIATYGAYDDQDRLTDYGTNDYAYTASGDLHQKTDTATGAVTTYDYDALGSLTKVTLPSGTVIDYVVDASGRRVGKKVDGSLTQGFLYGQALGPDAELDTSGNVRSRFVYGTRDNVPDYMTKNGNTYRIITDELGSPRIIVDASSGTIAQELDYDDFGRVTRDTNPGFQPFGFVGGLYDPDTKLVRFGARDYDPDAGRWTAKDPIRFAGGDTNLYGYVLGDPVNFTDPLGLFLGIDLPSPSEILDKAKDAGMYASNMAAGALNEITLGLSNKIAGVDGSCAGAGYGFGSFLADLSPRGLAKHAARAGIRKAARKEGKGAARPSPKFQPPTNPPQSPPDPSTIPPGWRVRVEPPAEQYPNGYWRIEKPLKNGGWQGIDPSTGQPGSHPETHIPLPPSR
jgi:RHS repeat-associated protein/uncharacterized repeat protein (TIGR01451 family)